MSDVFGIPSVTVPIKAGLDGFISDVSLIKNICMIPKLLPEVLPMRCIL